jgi:hypothetical protein
MGKGLLAWWRQRIVARGLAGVALLSVPVAVAALIGFGTSLSGVAGGLSAVTSGPDAVPASSPTAPVKLNRAVVALAKGQSSGTVATTGWGRSTDDASNPTITGTGGGTGGGSDTATTGGSGGGSDTASAPTLVTPPDVSVPGTDTSTGDTVDTVNNTVNGTFDNTVNNTVDNVLGGVNNTLNGLLGQ